MADICTHLDTIADVTPSSTGCEDCERIGGRWVHLRMCMTCGHVGCCDNSPNRHATTHWHEHPDHPLIRSYEPGETWWWCYPDELFFDLARPPSCRGGAMSGPVTAADTNEVDAAGTPVVPTQVVEITESAVSRVGEFSVRRALPRRTRRMIGAWCFIDHMGPATVDERGLGVAPHPHIGLQTVTWLLAGEALHRDSLGTEQVIAPGQLNLMTAGHGVSHSEEGTGYGGQLHGVQLWVAQPDHTRHEAAAFEHHADLPQVEFDHAVATVVIGELAGVISPARRDSDHAGIDLNLRPGRTTIPLRSDYEHGLVVLTGTCTIDGANATPGHLAYLGVGRDEITLTTEKPTRALLVGGVPFDQPVLMWWNYVARTRDEITSAHHDWTERAARFGYVDSPLPRYEIGPPPWTPQ